MARNWQLCRWILCVWVLIEFGALLNIHVDANLIPEVTRISPSSGPTDGGFQVTVSGLFVDSNGQVLINGVTCKFGASEISAIVVNARTITCTAPSAGAGDTTFEVLVNGQRWSNTTLTFTYYSCSALTTSDPCTSCFVLPLCGICIPTMQCASQNSCASGFRTECPVISTIAPGSASIVGNNNFTVTFNTSVPPASYQCSYSSSTTTIANTATPAVAISSNSITCKPPPVTNWNAARGSNRQLVVDLVIKVSSSAATLASKPKAINLYDCDTYGQDCSGCISPLTQGECAFCFDLQECHYSSVQCTKTGTCPSISSLSPSRIYIGAVSSQVMTLSGKFSFLSGQTFYCAYGAVGDSMGANITPGTYVSSTSLACNVYSGLGVGTQSISLWLYSSFTSSYSRVGPDFPFDVYPCTGTSCSNCLDGTKPECVFCSATATCNHTSSFCANTKLTVASSCPNITTLSPRGSPITGGISVALSGAFDTSAISDVSCIWTHQTESLVVAANTTGSTQCLAPAVPEPTVGSVYLSVFGRTSPWTNSLPFTWFSCENVTGSCSDCLTTSDTCSWCISHCSTECEGHKLDVCPSIVSIDPSFVRANSDTKQLISVTGGPFFSDVQYSCLFGDLTEAAMFVNGTTLACYTPVFLVGNMQLTVVAYDQPYTNAVDLEVFECFTNTSGPMSCSSQCIQQPHCGWCVVSSTCSAQDLCAQEDVFLDECLEITISPDVFNPRFDTPVTITVMPRLPPVWFSSKRAATSVTDVRCSLSTGESVLAVVTSDTTLTCDLPLVTTNEQVTLTITFQNRTLVGPVLLQTFDCSVFTSCEQCSSSPCTWCGDSCALDYACTQKQGCTSTAPHSNIADGGQVKPEVVAPAVVVPVVVVTVAVVVLVVLLKRRKKNKSKRNDDEDEMTSINNEKLLQEAEKSRQREEKQRLAEEKKVQREEQKRQKEAEQLRLEAKRLQEKADKKATPVLSDERSQSSKPASSIYVEQVGGTHYNSIDANQTKRKKNAIAVPVLDSINEKMKIPFDSLEMKKEIGAGSYGKVYLGGWQGAKVAIKVCATVANVDGFFDEAVLTIGLPPHPNVVQTFGISVDGALPCIVLEYCGGGSLDKKLFDEEDAYSFEAKVGLIKGIAHGLLHLHKHNIVHRDLAARNILLTRDGKPKISDFGMSRLLKEESQKGQTKNNIGPLRWMAPESIADMTYSTKSDVWTFGILMYEILSGNEPHTNMNNIEVAMKIKNDYYHPEISLDWNEHLRDVLLSCWRPDPEQRPSMQEIAKKLQQHFVSDENSD